MRGGGGTLFQRLFPRTPGEQPEVISSPLEHALPNVDDGGLGKAYTSVPEPPRKWDVCVVGAGLSGGVIAERYATLRKQSVLIVEKRRHIAGNCYDFLDDQTGLRLNLYGPHNFHTKLTNVWDYVKRFGRWAHYYHKKLAWSEGRFVPFPLNTETLNTIYDQHLMGANETAAFLAKIAEPCGPGGCSNSEQQSVASVGRAAYNQFYRGYTLKQWGVDPSQLDALVTGRISVRSDFDNRYFTDRYQSQPRDGYTRWMAGILSDPLIDLVLGVDWFDVQQRLAGRCGKLIFTGPIDHYFADSGLPKLTYRSLRFEKLAVLNIGEHGYYQPGTSVNYPEMAVPFTRSTEYKHYPGQPRSNHTVVVRETSGADGEPYYPVPNPRNHALYAKYKALADKEALKGVHFVGRLANYKYFNMDQAIDNALRIFDGLDRDSAPGRPPVKKRKKEHKGGAHEDALHFD